MFKYIQAFFGTRTFTTEFIEPATEFLSHMNTVHDLNLNVRGYLEKVADTLA
jgi:hypothetical protein